jgi:toxin HigB-1
VIKTFRHKVLRQLFETGSSGKIPPTMRKRIERQLDVIDSAQTVNGVNVPGYKLHRLAGSRAGEWAISVTGNWRITFKFENGDALDVNLEDYH